MCGLAGLLDGVDLHVKAGEFVGVIGPNGCGKSTLLRVASGAIAPVAGEAFLQGSPLASYGRRQLARRLAVVAQEARTDFDFSVRQVVMMGRYPFIGRFSRPGLQDIEAVDRAMEQARIGYLADRGVTHLSGGERQRVVMARALAQEADLLFLDEPTNHLDINHQVEIFELLGRLNQQRGLTIFCITHDLNLAAHYCHRLVLLDAGRVVVQGLPGEVLRSEILQQAYGIDLWVGEAAGVPQVFPIRRQTGS